MTRTAQALPTLVAHLLLLALGGAALAMPEVILARVSQLSGPFETRDWLMRGFGAGMIALSLALWIDARRAEGQPVARLLWLLGAGLTASFLLYAQQLSQWWIDDAGITFSYARSLAEGAGLTYQPGQPPTEGYSSTLWMATLALAHLLTFDIPQAAKTIGLGLTVLTLWISITWVWRVTDSALAMVLTVAAIGTAPTVVWSTSGQEHALQALLLLLIGVAAHLRLWRLPVALLLSLLIWTRPETPLIVIAVFVAALYMTRVEEGRTRFLRNLILAALPLAAFAGLMAFRMQYFGDHFPNPYHAKTSASSLAGLVNPFGGGWRYVWGGLQDSGLILLLPLVMVVGARDSLPRRWVIFAALAGHIGFVVWAKGDWMGQYRFLMPVLPLIVVPAVIAIDHAFSIRARAWLATLASVALFANTLTQVDKFDADPTTPLAVVSEIGQNFAKVAERMSIQTPLLAHHDAGAISYERSIGLVDLGGLVDRDVAKNMGNADFLRPYIFEQTQPHFIFGARNFAAASGFLDGPELARDYVPLRFPNHPIMASDYSHIRRDAVQVATGITLTRDADGTLTEVIVTDLEP
ncbi:hypothetical protein ANTHELSMS3_04327 [Antarctobacter heliothermus]|uniref:Glycosyltransferase RgtA/B/C/D-like domain-containing protein n=1 Tax=Antarctobacter heliothermus TaxID=74033 RepID=A0A222EAE8_9RHOB|nr:hypothetical protein [Antarctobacter heliothermus]ASP22931.1 hypothetical protein ANTHELSMS3_04327 [Antarctobacter heliothermus]